MRKSQLPIPNSQFSSNSQSRRGRLLAVAGAVAAGAALALGGGAAAQQPNFDNVQVDVQRVSGNVHMLVGAGGNVTVQAGPEGALVVDTQFAPMSQKLLTAIGNISDDMPIRYVVNTHVHPDHIGGNENFAKAGRTRAGGNVVGDIGGAATGTATVLAHENVLKRMSSPAAGQPQAPFAAWPTDTFFTNEKHFLFNGEAVQLIHVPNAHTDGDILVFFRRSDVLATGDLFVTTGYPYIDRTNGGNINGYIKGLNKIIDITVPSNVNEGGTMVVPGHGRLTDEMDVVEYRDAITIVRDRIQAMAKKGMTLEQVRAARPTLDFDPRYGADSGFWTTAQFIEAVYRDVSGAAASPAGRTQ
jgi:glyoxylase-like metal-dependent hydrolase (beta-lactamase superfamily II)